jgi:hypothetical protein
VALIVDTDRGVILRRHRTAKTPIIEDKQLHTAERPPLGRAVPTSAPSSLTLSEPHARASTVLLNEFDPSGFQSAPNYFQSCSTRFIQSALELTNGHDANSGSIGKLLLCPVQESAGCPAL